MKTFKSCYFSCAWVKVVKKVPHTCRSFFGYFAGHRQGLSDCLLAKNVSQRVIAKKLGISRNGISEILNKFQGTRIISNLPRCGHPQKVKHGMVRKLIGTAKAQPKKSARRAMDEHDLSNSVSVDNTKRIPRGLELNGCISAKKKKQH